MLDLADNLQPAFYFRVAFLVGSRKVELSFSEVSGMRARLQTESVVEGGENRFVHRLPGHTRYSNLVLKRAQVKKDDYLMLLSRMAFEEWVNVEYAPLNIIVSLLDEKGDPVNQWEVLNAYPVVWDIEPFIASHNSLAIDRLEFSYTHLERINSFNGH